MEKNFKLKPDEEKSESSEEEMGGADEREVGEDSDVVEVEQMQDTPESTVSMGYNHWLVGYQWDSDQVDLTGLAILINFQ